MSSKDVVLMASGAGCVGVAAGATADVAAGGAALGAFG